MSITRQECWLLWALGVERGSHTSLSNKRCTESDSELRILELTAPSGGPIVHYRKSVIGTAVALLIGVPAIAYAATGSTLTTFSGQTRFADPGIALKLLSVTSRSAGSTGGVDCTSARLAGDANFQVDPVAKRVLDNAALQVQPGTCDITIRLKNLGTATVTPSVRLAPRPTGWSAAVVDPRPIVKGRDGTVVLRLSVARGAAAGPIGGVLTDGAVAPEPGPPPPVEYPKPPVPDPPPTTAPPQPVDPPRPTPSPVETTPRPADPPPNDTPPAEPDPNPGIALPPLA